MHAFDCDKSLQQLEGEVWGDSDSGPTHLVEECLRLRRVPLREFTPGDLRIMIGQNIGLEYLLLLAFEALEKDPFVEGSYYRGDLLCAVLGVASEFWRDQPQFRLRAEHFAQIAFSELHTLDSIDRRTFEEAVSDPHARFSKATKDRAN